MTLPAGTGEPSWRRLRRRPCRRLRLDAGDESAPLGRVGDSRFSAPFGGGLLGPPASRPAKCCYSAGLLRRMRTP